MSREPRRNPQAGDVLTGRGPHKTRRVTRRYGDAVTYQCSRIRKKIPIESWLSWAKNSTVETIGDYDGPDRDPCTAPICGDIFYRKDQDVARARRHVVEVKKTTWRKKTKITVQFRLPDAAGNPLRSCSLRSWWGWAGLAVVESRSDDEPDEEPDFSSGVSIGSDNAQVGGTA